MKKAKIRETIDTLTEQQSRLLAELQSVLAINRALVSEINLNHLLEFIITQAEHLMNAKGAAVFLLDPEHRRLALASPGESWLPITPGASFPLQASLAEEAFASQQVLIRNADDSCSIPICDLLPPAECVSLLCAPLTIQGKNLGVLLIWSNYKQAFSRHDSRLLGLFADQAALALNNAEAHAKNRQLAIEQERHRLARELHDSVSQSLYSIGLAAASSLKKMERGTAPEVEARVEYIHHLSRRTLIEIRERLHGLYPTMLDAHGLSGTLHEFCHVLTIRYSVAVTLAPCIEPPLTAHQKEELYYIAKEALWNAIKHANATRITVKMETEPTRFALWVEDDGTGFEPALITIEETIGLRSMQERVNFLGGSLQIESTPGSGTRIGIKLPLNKYPPSFSNQIQT